MCYYATAMENKGIEKGIERGIEQGIEQGIERGIEKGLKALVQSLKEYIKDFDTLYMAITRNEDYEDVSKEEVMKYYFPHL